MDIHDEGNRCREVECQKTLFDCDDFRMKFPAWGSPHSVKVVSGKVGAIVAVIHAVDVDQWNHVETEVTFVAVVVVALHQKINDALQHI